MDKNDDMALSEPIRRIGNTLITRLTIYHTDGRISVEYYIQDYNTRREQDERIWRKLRGDA